MAYNDELTCNHSVLRYTPSPHAQEVGYHQPSIRQRAAAVKPTRKSKGEKAGTQILASPGTFPAPLLLPGDDLSLGPDHPSQSFSEWLNEVERNEVTLGRNAVYVVPQPEIDTGMGFMNRWKNPQINKTGENIPMAHAQEVVGYLSAFYHGLPVRLLAPADLKFVAWESARKSKSSPRHVGLGIGEECTRIRTRVCPDGLFPRQLNLDDLIDAAINMLPNDAYALLFLVNHDLYEDEEDLFVCGRAYGGSRVAVVSSARYNPCLDSMLSVERLHAWPASHCDNYVVSCCTCSAKSRSKTNKKNEAGENTPLEAALRRSMLPDVDLSPSQLSTLWLSRICRTSSHELGHCFGIDHCVYYACAMQGSSSVSEDARQPPYLCPVDLAKVLSATGTTARQRYLALAAYCDKPGNEGTMFSSLAAWIRHRLAEMEQ